MRTVIAWAHNSGGQFDYWQPLHHQLPQVLKFINMAKDIPDELTPYIHRIRQSLIILVKERECTAKQQKKRDYSAKKKR